MARRDASERSGDTALLIACVAVIGAAAVIWCVWRAGLWLTGWTGPVTGPIGMPVALARGTIPWPIAATILLIAAAAAAIACAVVVYRKVVAGRSVAERDFDRLARYLASGREMADVCPGPQARAKAMRLQPDLDEQTLRAHPDLIGPMIGRLVNGGRTVYASAEDVGVEIGGARSGKTATSAIPKVCAHRGPALITSNKNDLHHHTRGVREEIGTVWVSDLQGIAGDEQQDFWWNPLRPVTTLKAARRITGYFAAASTEQGQRTDAYFDGGAKELLALYVFAAAAGGGDIYHAYGWLDDPDLTVPEDTLTEAGHRAAASRIRTARELNGRQRDGLFDMARRFLNVLSDPLYASSVTPPVRTHFPADNSVADDALPATFIDPDRREFICEQFVESTDSLYLLSMEGPDAATALTTGLAGSVFDAAMRAARRRGGRLGRPLLGMLDEAANICRLKEIPAWFSHFGSQGIQLWVILQSSDQAVRVWGEQGARELITQANILVYGGANRIADGFLKWLSEMIGTRVVRRYSRSSSRGGGSVSQSHSREPIMEISDLTGMPPRRGIVSISGHRPAAYTKIHWTATPWAEAIDASIAACIAAGKPLYDPDTAAAHPLEFADLDDDVDGVDAGGDPFRAVRR